MSNQQKHEGVTVYIMTDDIRNVIRNPASVDDNFLRTMACEYMVLRMMMEKLDHKKICKAMEKFVNFPREILGREEIETINKTLRTVRRGLEDVAKAYHPADCEDLKANPNFYSKEYLEERVKSVEYRLKVCGVKTSHMSWDIDKFEELTANEKMVEYIVLMEAYLNGICTDSTTREI